MLACIRPPAAAGAHWILGKGVAPRDTAVLDGIEGCHYFCHPRRRPGKRGKGAEHTLLHALGNRALLLARDGLGTREFFEILV
jgi:hypothetical protein